MLRIVGNDFSESPWMECMLRIVVVTGMSLSRAMQEQLPKNDSSESPWMECMPEIVRNDSSESPCLEK